eukprot:gene10794-22536_t
MTFSSVKVEDASATDLIIIEIVFTSFTVIQSLHQTHLIRKESIKHKAKKSVITLSIKLSPRNQKKIRST